MKRILTFFIVLLIIVSCGQQDKRIALVKKEFKAYVNKNFDDPKSVKEIVEIIPKDTISLEKMKAICSITDEAISQSRQLYHLKDSLLTDKLEEYYNIIRKSRGLSYSDALTGQLIAIDLMSTFQKVIDTKKVLMLEQSQLKAIGDSLQYYAPLYLYEIKYRNMSNDGLKLETSYAYIDSLTGFKAILPKQNDMEMISSDYYTVIEKSADCMKTVEKIESLYKEQEEQFEKLDRFMLKAK